MKNFKTNRSEDIVFKTWGHFLDYVHKHKIGGGVNFYNLKGKLINKVVLISPLVQDRSGWGH